ncbi:MAG: NAD-dependent epimerase [Xanthomonas sp.]|nr:NAD-dependent epimerase [Xanthomonas sp.]
MRALIVGGNGFLGVSLVERLRLLGCSIKVLDARPPRADFDWQGVEYTVGALADEAVLDMALEGIEAVFHLASTTVPGTSNADPVFDVSSNLLGALKLMLAMQRHGIRRMVFFSSGGTVYGEPELLPVPEAHVLKPISSYGVVKVAIEDYLHMYHRLGQLDPLVVRPSNPYGARQAAGGLQGAIAAFLAKARTGEKVSIWGDGSIVRDYVYIDDLVELVARAGLSDYCGVLNAGSGEGFSLNRLCEMIREVTGAALPVEYLPGRAYDVKEVVLDISRATELFDWKPTTSLADGISATWNAKFPTHLKTSH